MLRPPYCEDTPRVNNIKKNTDHGILNVKIGYYLNARMMFLAKKKIGKYNNCKICYKPQDTYDNYDYKRKGYSVTVH